MHIVYFLFSTVLFIAAVFAPVNAVGAGILVLASFGFLCFGIWRLLRERMGGRIGPDIAPFSADELRQLREKAERERNGPQNPVA